MTNTPYSKEWKAIDLLHAWLRQAQEVKACYDDAGMATPPPLARALGIPLENGVKGASRKPRLFVSPPDAPPRPEEATEDWIWLPVAEATPTLILLATLRQRDGFMPSKEAIDAVVAIKVINTGSLFNVAARLDRKLIERSADGWKLKDRTRAPVLFEGYLWGAPDVFGKNELAAHRRYLIMHLLSAAPGGLQVVQIVDQLSADEMCHAPVTKDLVKCDMENLQQEGKAKRIGNSKKWARVDQKT